METIWFIFVALMVTMYVLLDGFDLGAGAVHLFVARNDRERRAIIRAIGPVWDGNEVWLIAAGGTLFFAFPTLYASGFSGFYLPLIIVLWLLMIRGLSIELRGHINDPLWTDFSPFSDTPGILDWYTVLIGLLALTTLVVHGSNFIAVKTEDDLNARSRRIARGFSFATVLLTVVATLATFWVSPEMLRSFNERPYGYVLPLVAVAGLIGMVFFDLRGRDREAFLSSGAYIVGMLTSTVFGVYPNVLPAVDPANSLTIQNASASTYSMTVGLVWWSIGMVLAAVYFIVIYRLFRGKVRL